MNNRPRFCETCGLQAGWHKLKCPHFAPVDEREFMAAFFFAMLDREQEERRRMSEGGIRDDLEKRFKLHAPGGTTHWRGIDCDNGAQVFRVDFDWRGNRLTLRIWKLDSKYRDETIDMIAWDAASSLRRMPCSHPMKKLVRSFKDTPTSVKEWIRGSCETTTVEVRQRCEDCGDILPL